MTPRENAEVNGPWICNKGRDLTKIYERPRATQAMQKGKIVDLDTALVAARRLIDGATRPLALVSSWGSNEELEAFRQALGGRFTAWVKSDHVRQAGEPLEDDLLIVADKNPNTAAARALFPQQDDGERALPADIDLVLVWGEGFDFARLPPKARVIFLNSYLQPENGHADVFIPISVATERAGHYTNFQGTVSAFEPCFARPAGVADAATVFAAIAVAEGVQA